MKIFRIAALLVAFTLGGSELKQADGKRWWSHVQFLADDSLEGRETGTPGYRKAANYVAAGFQRNDLQPAGTSAYFQKVKLRSRKIVEERSEVALFRDGHREPLKLGDEVIIALRSEPPRKLRTGLVFAGYGLRVPEKRYDDFAGLDVRGKVVVMLSGSPKDMAGPLLSHYQSAGERRKVLDSLGIAGTISIANPKVQEIPWTRTASARFTPAMSLDTGLRLKPFLTLTMNPASAEPLFAGSGHTFEEILKKADTGEPLPRFAIPAELDARVAVEERRLESENVVGLLPGSDSGLRKEYVVLSAHLDHLGKGRPIGGDAIYNGAIDNASGIASLLDIAAMFKDSGRAPRRSLLFLAVTGEEKGLLGSSYFTAYPTVKANDIVADLNLDMFMPLFPLKIITAMGLNESDLGDRLREVASSVGLRVEDDPEPQQNRFIRSDQYSFIKRGIPALAFKFGWEKGSGEEQICKQWLKERYHAPSDDLQQPVDIKAAGEFNQALRMLAEDVANREARPQWKEESFFKRFAKTEMRP